jgi:hypothetical protein
MLLIEGYREARRDEEFNGWNGRVMRLGIGIQDDVYLDAPSVGSDERASQSLRMQQMRLH